MCQDPLLTDQATCPFGARVAVQERAEGKARLAEKPEEYKAHQAHQAYQVGLVGLVTGVERRAPGRLRRRTPTGRLHDLGPSSPSPFPRARTPPLADASRPAGCQRRTAG